MNKKGDIWVSAVLYFGLGIIIITILLAAGLPVINRLRDKNIAIQTKEVFHLLDQNIREVLKGGPGTQKVVTLSIKKGEFRIDPDSETIEWTYNSRVFLSEPDGSDVRDGNVIIKTKRGTTKGMYDISLTLNYNYINSVADINLEATMTISGIGDVSVRNGGASDISGKTKLIISEVGKRVT